MLKDYGHALGTLHKILLYMGVRMERFLVIGPYVVISLTCYLIYKYRLVHSLDNRYRPVEFNSEFYKFKCELELRMDIYEK